MTALEAAREVLRDWDEGRPRQYNESINALCDLIQEHEELLAKYDALRTARPFTAGRPVFELPIKDVGGTMLKQ